MTKQNVLQHNNLMEPDEGVRPLASIAVNADERMSYVSTTLAAKQISAIFHLFILDRSWHVHQFYTGCLSVSLFYDQLCDMNSVPLYPYRHNFELDSIILNITDFYITSLAHHVLFNTSARNFAGKCKLNSGSVIFSVSSLEDTCKQFIIRRHE